MSTTKFSTQLRHPWAYFALVFVPTLVVFILYGINIVNWRNSADFGWRAMYESGPNVAADLFERARSAGLQVGDNIVDINESNTGLGDSNDYVLLTLNNGSVDMFPGGAADRFTVRIKSGYYMTHIYEADNWDEASDYQPQLFCEVAKR